MITLIDGVMGSGKSFYLANHIYYNHNKYNKVYTNLDSFKLDRFDNVYLYKESKFLELMSECKDIYDDEDTTDDDIIKHLIDKEFLAYDDLENLLPVLIVVDEIHNSLAKSNDLYTWILTYHRHLYIDFIFATQDSTLIFQKYHKTFQQVYRALPSDRNFFNMLSMSIAQLRGKQYKSSKNRYQQHLKLPIIDGSKGTFLKNIYLKADDKIYDLYKSGDAVRSKSVFTRFVIMAIIFILVAVIAFFSFVSHLIGATDEDITAVNDAVPTYSTVVNKPTIVANTDSYSNLTYVTLSCIDNLCTEKDRNIKVYIDDLNTTLSNTDSKLLGVLSVGESLGYIRLLVTKDFIKLFEKENNNVKNNSFKIL